MMQISFVSCCEYTYCTLFATLSSRPYIHAALLPGLCNEGGWGEGQTKSRGKPVLMGTYKNEDRDFITPNVTVEPCGPIKLSL